jgi:hypothetical protein
MMAMRTSKAIMEFPGRLKRDHNRGLGAAPVNAL